MPRICRIGLGCVTGMASPPGAAGAEGREPKAGATPRGRRDGARHVAFRPDGKTPGGAGRSRTVLRDISSRSHSHLFTTYPTVDVPSRRRAGWGEVAFAEREKSVFVYECDRTIPRTAKSRRGRAGRPCSRGSEHALRGHVRDHVPNPCPAVSLSRDVIFGTVGTCFVPTRAATRTCVRSLTPAPSSSRQRADRNEVRWSRGGRPVCARSGAPPAGRSPGRPPPPIRRAQWPVR
jgi:hypothetical protein